MNIITFLFLWTPDLFWQVSSEIDCEVHSEIGGEGRSVLPSLFVSVSLSLMPLIINLAVNACGIDRSRTRCSHTGGPHPFLAALFYTSREGDTSFSCVDV